MRRKKADKKTVETGENKPKPTTIIQYIKKPGGETRGVMAAYTDGTRYSLGYSLVNKAAGDRFDRERGLKQATVRAQRNLKNVNATGISVPPSIFQSMILFEERAKNYFKDKTPGYTNVVSQADYPKPLTENEQASLDKLFRPDDLDALLVLAKKYNRQLPKTVLEIIDRQTKKATKTN